MLQCRHNQSANSERKEATRLNPQKVEPTDLLMEKRLRTTPLRLRTLMLLLRKREPLSHTEIFEELSQTGDAPDRVTLYRTLSVFADVALVHQILGTDGTLRFCLHDPFRPGCPGDHPHFLCRTCGRMTCLPGQALPHVEVPEGTAVDGKQLLIFGRCSQCKED